MMNQDIPRDFVLGSGIGHSVKDFIDIVYKKLEMPLDWSGSYGKTIRAYHKEKLLVKSMSKYYRPLEVDCLIANPSLAAKCLSWKTNITLSEMIDEMIREEKNALSTS